MVPTLPETGPAALTALVNSIAKSSVTRHSRLPVLLSYTDSLRWRTASTTCLLMTGGPRWTIVRSS